MDPLGEVVNSLYHKVSVLSKTSEETQAGICGIMTGILIWICLVFMTTKSGGNLDGRACRISRGKSETTQRTEVVGAMREETFW